MGGQRQASSLIISGGDNIIAGLGEDNQFGDGCDGYSGGGGHLASGYGGDGGTDGGDGVHLHHLEPAPGKGGHDYSYRGGGGGGLMVDGREPQGSI